LGYPQHTIDFRNLIHQILIIALGQAAGDAKQAAAAGFFIFSHLQDGIIKDRRG